MNHNVIQMQVFIEIATAIGRSERLEEMVRESLAAYLHKLSCAAGVVIRVLAKSDGTPEYVPIGCMPRRVNAEAALQEVLNSLPDMGAADPYGTLCESLPIALQLANGRHSYLMSLPGFGLLLLVKAGTPFDESLIKSLARLNSSFADACIFCLHSEETARINERLKREIEIRRHAEENLQQVLNELEQRVAERTRELVQANQELEDALASVKTLSGLLPICSTCKKIRDDQGYWKKIESYVSSHSEVMFTHSICPDCASKVYKEFGLSDQGIFTE